MSIKNEILNNMNLLKRIDPTNEFVITKRKFNNVDDSIKKELTGAEGKHYKGWEDFVRNFIQYQENLGFYWKRQKGKYDSFLLSEISFPKELIILFTKFIVNEKYTDQNVKTVLLSFFKMEDDEFFYDKINFNALKIILEEIELEDRKKIKFRKNGFIFQVGNDAYEYESELNGNKKKEKELGDRLYEGLRAFLGLDRKYFKHIQENRMAEKLQNVDYVGISISQTAPGFSNLDIISIELKPSNSLEMVTKAIMQAVNYKPFSNYVYILLPLFESSNFHDPDRYDDYYKLCQDNGIGIISFREESKKNYIFKTILQPIYSRVDDYEFFKSLIENKIFTIEYCTLCNRYIENERSTADTPVRKNCNWYVDSLDDEETSICMKVFLEKQVLGLVKNLTNLSSSRQKEI